MATSDITVTPGSGANVGVDTVGSNSIQIIKLWDGTPGSSNAALVNPDGSLLVDIGAGNITANITGNIVLGNGTNTIGQLTANQTVQVTNTVGTNANITGGNVTLLTGTASIGNIAAINSTVNANITGGNVTAAVTGNIGVTGNVTLAANQTVQVTSMPANITANVTASPPNQTVSLTQIANTTILTGGVAGSQGMGGLAANNATASGNPIQASAIAISAEATAATAGQNASMVVGLEHKLIVLPYANKENFVRGTASIANTTANVTVIAAQGAGNKTYITGLQIGNTGNTTITITTNDSANSVFIVPAGGGSNVPFHTPLVTAANTTFAFTCSANTTTCFVSAQGYVGT